MNADEFEKSVRELRQRQRRFFRCRKDDTDRPKALELMREQEKIVLEVVQRVNAIRPEGKVAKNEREQFFIDVATMMVKQKQWAKSGGGRWDMNPAREYEQKVDRWLEEFKMEKDREARAKEEELKKRQLELFK